MERFEDDGTWVWTAVDPVSKAVLAHVVGTRRQRSADDMLARVRSRVGSIPFFVSDGLKLYSRAILRSYVVWTEHPRTGMRGRPRKPGLVPPLNLRYAQVIKHRRDDRLAEVERRVVFGKTIHLHQPGGEART